MKALSCIHIGKAMLKTNKKLDIAEGKALEATVVMLLRLICLQFKIRQSINEGLVLQPKNKQSLKRGQTAENAAGQVCDHVAIQVPE